MIVKLYSWNKIAWDEFGNRVFQGQQLRGNKLHEVDSFENGLKYSTYFGEGWFSGKDKAMAVL